MSTQGLSHRAISERISAEGTKISHVSVGALLRRPVPSTHSTPHQPTTYPPNLPRPKSPPPHSSPPIPAPDPPRSKRAAPAVSVPKKHQKPAVTQGAIAPAVDLDEIKNGVESIDDMAPNAIEQLRRRHVQVGTLADVLLSDIVEGDYQPTQWSKLISLEQELATRITRLTPPPIPDPEKDPNNLEARDRLLARIESAVLGLENEPEVRAAMRAHLDALDHSSEQAAV